MKKELLFSVTKKDLEIDYFSGTGAGGQHRNKHQNCVRMHHPESGARSTGQTNRERQSNVREAFKSLIEHPKFKIWHSQRSMECLGKQTIQQKVELMMEPENLKIEGKNSKGRWEDLANELFGCKNTDMAVLNEQKI